MINETTVLLLFLKVIFFTQLMGYIESTNYLCIVQVNVVILFPYLVQTVYIVIVIKAESCSDDWTEIICSCWAFYPLFHFPGIWMVSSSRQEDLAATVIQQSKPSEGAGLPVE